MSNSTYTFPSVTINNMTFTATRWGQFPTISYTNGATAGSEVVSVDASFNITVQIQTGVSTNLQIKTAIAATAGSATGLSAGDLVSVSITTGHNNDTNVTVNKAFLVGGSSLTAATATIGSLLYTAKTAGTAGNSITVQYVGSLAFTVTTVTDGTHLVVSSTTGMFSGQTIKQGANSTTITTVTDATHIVVGNTTNWTGSGAAASSPAITAGNEIAGIGVTANTIVVQIGNNTMTNPFTGIATNNSSTSLQIAAAVAANSGTNALVSVASTGKNALEYVVEANPAITLSGGLAASAASKILQDLTYTSVANGANSPISITYTTGATAGAEVVSVVGNAISIQIQNGVSTATQIQTAFNAVGAATALATCTISGTGSNAQSTVNLASLTGAVGSNSLSFYRDNTITALTSSFVYFAFNNMMQNIAAYCDDTSGSNAVIFSFDGTNIAGTLLPTESVVLQNANVSGVYLKYGTGAPKYRFFAAGPR